MFDGSEGNTEAPVYRGPRRNVYRGPSRCIARRVRRDHHVFRLCLENRAGRCCPLAGAPTSTRRRSKLGTDKQPAGIYRTFRFVNPPSGAHATGAAEGHLYFSVGGDRDSALDHCSEAAKSRRAGRRHRRVGVVSTVMLD